MRVNIAKRVKFLNGRRYHPLVVGANGIIQPN